jgi:hypothetical protein
MSFMVGLSFNWRGVELVQSPFGHGWGLFIGPFIFTMTW